MNSFKKILVFIIAIAFSSCSTYYAGTTTSDASLSSNNFKMVQVATGTASIHSFMGIGGSNKDALVFEAKKDMLLNSPLKERQALANVTIDFTTSFFLVFRTQKVAISADIVEFNEMVLNKNEVRKTKIPEPQTDKTKDTTQPPGNTPVPKPIKPETGNASTPKVTKTETENVPASKATTTENENVPVAKAIKIEKENNPDPASNSTPTPGLGFEPTVRYSSPTEIVTSSGERIKAEAGDYFIGTLDEKGKPENGKLYDKTGRPKHVILPRRNH